jgi:hypothetical protein
MLQLNHSHQDLSQVPTRESEMASLPKYNLMRRARSCVTEFLFTVHVSGDGNCLGLISKCVLKLRKNIWSIFCMTTIICHFCQLVYHLYTGHSAMCGVVVWWAVTDDGCQIKQ